MGAYLSPGTNRYFSQFTYSGEQDLLEELIIEGIKIHGHDVFYMPRELVSYDQLTGEDDISEFNNAYPIEMYISSVNGFAGQGNFIDQFGLNIRDQVTFVVARRTFANEVGRRAEMERPNEGDLVYFPLNGKAFMIMFVNYKEFFYQLGKLYTWEITCELFEYSNERINTGIAEIDKLQTKFSTNLLDYSIVDENGDYLVDENDDVILGSAYDVSDMPGDNDVIQDEQESTGLTNWSEKDPYSEGNF